MQVAAQSNDTLGQSTYAMLSNISDTFRLLIESMDFMAQDGNGWHVLWCLCRATYGYSGEPAARRALLVWMLRLFSSEIKMYGIERHYGQMLIWTLTEVTGLVEASPLLLCLGGPGPIDKPIHYSGGYTITHFRTAYAECGESMRALLAQGPDVHKLGFDYHRSPEKESPFSLVLYSSWAFGYWLYALATAGKGYEEFVTQEIQKNHTTHPGWKKETLLNLSTYDVVRTVNAIRVERCCRRIVVRI